MSALQIHQSYFGAVKGTAHGQLASSLVDAELRAFLVGFTDRPGALPAGVVLAPYLTGGSHGNYFLVSRTWADTAVERPGMVFTHVLLVPLQQVGDLSNLGSLLGLLLLQPPPVSERTVQLVPLSLTNTEPGASASQTPKSWLEVLERLSGPASGTSVLVSGAPKAFERLLTALWQGMPSLMRASISWGVRFAPPSVKDSTPLLVYIPEWLSAKWRGAALVLLDEVTMKEPETPIEQLVFGGAQQSGFRDFIEALEISPTTFVTLAQSRRAFEDYKNLQRPTSDVMGLLALVRVLPVLQPDKNKAIQVKQYAIQALAGALTKGAIEQALALRNLPINSFKSGVDELARGIALNVEQLVDAPSADTDMQGKLLTHLAEGDDSRVQKWWQEAARAAFKQKVTGNKVTGAAVVWLGIVLSAVTRKYVLQIVPDSPSWEQALIKSLPTKLVDEAAETIMSFSAERNWWDLFAAVVGVTYTPVDALRRQVRVEKPLELVSSPRVLHLAGAVEGAELVKLAIAEPIPQLLKLAGERCSKNPKLLASLDVQRVAWRSVWTEALVITKNITAGLSKPAEVINAFLSEVAAGRANEQLPLELIAASTYANILHLPERVNLWDKLPNALLPQFLGATLDALTEEILTLGWTGTVEPMMSKAAQGIVFTTKFLGQRRNDLAAVLAVHAVLQNLTDQYLRDYVGNLPSLNGVVAAQLGKLVFSRRWQLSADAILHRAKYISDFRPALHECSEMFSWLTKVINYELFGHQVKSDDAWKALEQIMLELFEKGPDQGEIWKKAGGKSSKLTDSHSRETQWASAIELLKRGGGGHITAESLINAALEKYPKNSGLLALSGSKHLFKTW